MAQPAVLPQIGYVFKSPQLLTQAITHRSFGAVNNERLEFLGDGALNFIIAHQLFLRFPKLPEGDLSRLRAQLVKESTLAEIAGALNLGDMLKLGEGELKSAGWRRPSILSDALEAIIGAVYTDGGFAAVETLVLKLFDEKLTNIDPKTIDKDPKSQLQEYLQSRKIELPDYQITQIVGEAHAQTFTVACVIAKLNIRTIGEGISRRAAEQQAAQFALEHITKVQVKK
jgi:ribonuclease III